MIKISKMADYAVVLLSALARAPDQVMSVSAIAEITHLPEPTVSKILKSLVKENLISSVRGIKGGYCLGSSPENITVQQIIVAIDGPIEVVACVDGQADDCSLTEICGVRGRWDDVNRVIKEALSEVTLADMMPRRRSERVEVVHGRH